MRLKSTPQQSFLLAFIFVLSMATVSCRRDKSVTPVGAVSFQQTNLVADSTGFGAARIDANLNNPWGIAIGPTGALWISDNHSGNTSIYDGSGNTLLANVGIPLHGVANGSAPTGVVYNATTSFMIPANGLPAKFIYVSEDGIVAGWNTGDTTVTLADRSAQNAIYKGVAIATDGGSNFIYAADFHNAKVDVFDQSFNLVNNKPFVDPSIPAGFAPFNIQNIGGQLYVTYAKQSGPDNEDDQAGAGFGYVDVYKADGSFVKRFASQGTLNSPWAVAQAPAGFGLGTNAILVGNFGDGRINIYDAAGAYQGQLSNNGSVIAINGLWALTFPTSTAGGLDLNTLYFTAGPQGETYGIFGNLKRK